MSRSFSGIFTLALSCCVILMFWTVAPLAAQNTQSEIHSSAVHKKGHRTARTRTSAGSRNKNRPTADNMQKPRH